MKSLNNTAKSNLQESLKDSLQQALIFVYHSIHYLT